MQSLLTFCFISSSDSALPPPDLLVHCLQQQMLLAVAIFVASFPKSSIVVDTDFTVVMSFLELH